MADQVWPTVPAEGTNVYQFVDTHGTKMVTMREEAWLNYGTIMERFRRAAHELDAKVKELHAANGEAVTKCNEVTAKYNELSEKHQALRETLAARMREEMSRTLILPDAKDFPRKR